jgi:lysophospholipase L1-like esterase
MSGAATPRRVAIVGNSNSVMRTSYANLLAAKGGVEVVNRSIGGCPNVLLLDFLASLAEAPEPLDTIVVETSVIDGELQRLGLDRAERSDACLQLFLQSIGALTPARVVILLIPTPLALLTQEQVPVRAHYRAVASRFGVPVFDGYDLMASLCTLPARVHPEAAARTLAMLEAFALPQDRWASFLWSAILPKFIAGISAYARHFFADDLHLSPEGHAIIADLLHGWLMRSHPVFAIDPPAGPIPLPVARARPSVPPERLVRLTNSLISRDFAPVLANEQVEYLASPGWRVGAVMVNAAATSGYLQLETAHGARSLDLRLAVSGRPFEANLVPLLDPLPVGPDGRVTVAIRPTPPPATATQAYWNLDTTRSEGRAELAELILIGPEGPPPQAVVRRSDPADCEIVAQGWAQLRIQELGSFAGTTAETIEAAQALLNRAMLEHVLGSADDDVRRLLARMLLSAGDLQGVVGLLDAALQQRPDDARLTAMRSSLDRLSAVLAV